MKNNWGGIPKLNSTVKLSCSLKTKVPHTYSQDLCVDKQDIVKDKLSYELWW